ncbi:MAG: tRNA lysidine(34) synthetase TilS [Eubacteriales bacterium]|nr:tRNA lysidine(34) synthetase TilS [Eubacteriales bacterium]
MEDLRKKTERAMREQEMTEPGGNVLAGVSGGADSVCLLCLLCELQHVLKFTLRAMHIQHGLRGIEAEQDEAYVRLLCRSLGVPYRAQAVPVAVYAREKGLGTEEAARQLRYEALEREARAISARTGRPCRIAVAHHREDQAETVLFHLCRGTGLRGLRGMLPAGDRVIRPLLGAERAGIEAYLREREISWREDRSNRDETYTRNRLRHRVLPMLEREINAQTAAHIAAAAAELGEIEAYLEEQAERAWERCRIGSGASGGGGSRIGDGPRIQSGPESESGLRIGALLEQPPVLQKRILYLALAEAAGGERDLQRVHIEALQRLIGSQGNGMLSLPRGVTARKSYDILSFSRENAGCGRDGRFPAEIGRGPEMTDRCLIGTGGSPDRDSVSGGMAADAPLQPDSPCCPLAESEYEWEIVSNPFPDGAVPEMQYTKWLDYDKIGAFPVFRTRRQGDRLTIRDTGESKSLSRLMIDARIPAQLRSRMVLPTHGSEVLWVPGCRINAAYKVSHRTGQVLRLALRTEESGRPAEAAYQTETEASCSGAAAQTGAGEHESMEERQNG